MSEKDFQEGFVKKGGMNEPPSDQRPPPPKPYPKPKQSDSNKSSGRESKKIMKSGEITRLWNQGELKKEDIFEYFKEEIAPTSAYLIDFADLDHIVDMCFSLYQWSAYNIPIGDFLRAVVSDSWKSVCSHADDCNRQWSWMIYMFLYNCAPGNWNLIALKDALKAFEEMEIDKECLRYGVY